MHAPGETAAARARHLLEASEKRHPRVTDDHPAATSYDADGKLIHLSRRDLRILINQADALTSYAPFAANCIEVSA